MSTKGSNNGAVIPDNTGKTYRSMKMMNVKADIFKQFFLNPTSSTFMNVRGSAMRAGYSEQYSDNLTVQRPKWWLEIIESAEYNRARMLSGAEKNLTDTIYNNPENETELKLQHDASKFIAERLGKDHYSTRTELTDKGGRRLIPSDSRVNASIPLVSLFKGVKEGG